MGLSVTAWPHATLVPHHLYPDVDHEDCGSKDHVRAFAYGGFERSYAGLALPDRRFAFPGEDEPTNIGGVCYTVSGDTARVDMSYGGHNRLRDLLATTFIGVPATDVWANPADYYDAPFYELVNFADNEGTIGPVAAAAFTADFDAGADKWADLFADDDLDWYTGWTKIAHTAADTGIIRFG